MKEVVNIGRHRFVKRKFVKRGYGFSKKTKNRLNFKYSIMYKICSAFKAAAAENGSEQENFLWKLDFPNRFDVSSKHIVIL